MIFQKGQNVVWLGGDRLYPYGVKTLFRRTNINLNAKKYKIRDLFVPYYDTYIYEVGDNKSELVYYEKFDKMKHLITKAEDPSNEVPIVKFDNYN